MQPNGSILRAGVPIATVLCGIMIFWNVGAFGEEWTDAQKEVWDAIETRWKQYKEGDYESIVAGIHEDAHMWFDDNNSPLQKPETKSVYHRWMYYAKPVTYELKPYAIQIFGDIANVMFAYRWSAERKFTGHNRTLVTLKKHNGKWLIISSLSASCERLPHCLDW